MTAAKKPVVNQDLWQELDEQVARHKTTWIVDQGPRQPRGQQSLRRTGDAGSASAVQKRIAGDPPDRGFPVNQRLHSAGP